MISFSRTFRVVAVAFALALVACGSGEAQQRARVAVENSWAATTNPGATVGAGYVTLRNAARQTDTLQSASSPRARRVELHEMSMAGGVMRMRPVEGIEVPAGGSVTLQPGGLHIMFMEIDSQFQEGERVPVTLHFERAGDVRAEFVVRPRTVAGSNGHEH